MLAAVPLEEPVVAFRYIAGLRAGRLARPTRVVWVAGAKQPSTRPVSREQVSQSRRVRCAVRYAVKIDVSIYTRPIAAVHVLVADSVGDLLGAEICALGMIVLQECDGDPDLILDSNRNPQLCASLNSWFPIHRVSSALLAGR